VNGSIDEIAAASRAAREWWDREAAAYQAEHGDFLGPIRFRWGPEGLDEAETGLLGRLGGRTVLELGAGAAQCSRWLRTQGASAYAMDLSGAQLADSARLDAETGIRVPAVQADALALPFGAESFDLACSSYGAIPFVADLEAIHREVRRVLRNSGRWVFSVTHPVRWAFLDDPGPRGLTAVRPYFDRTPYAERDDSGRLLYAEFHRTVGDHVRALVSTGFRLIDVVEPEWPDDNDQIWGGWSRLRGKLLPGTAIFVAQRDG